MLNNPPRITILTAAIVLAGLHLCSAAGASSAQPDSAPGQAQVLDRLKADALDRLIAAYMAKNGIPGLTAAVALDGKAVWTKGYGLADVENSVAAGPDTMFRTCSIGKTMTATAAMRLVEQGKLDLDAPIQRYCPAFPKKPWVITPRHLLTHMSGIRHYGGPRDLEEQTSTFHYPNVVAALAPFKDDPLAFEPGTNFLYSTYGYDVLACVIEGAAGQPFMDVIRRLVFEPAGMAHSRDDDPGLIIPGRAAGYRLVQGRLTNAPHVDMSNRLGAGGFITTASDVAAFAAMFMDGRLVSPATRDAMLTEQAMTNGDIVNYGLGWSIAETKDGRTTGEASHGGSCPGQSGLLYTYPKHRVAVVFLTNLEDAPGRFETAVAIAKVAAGF